MNRAAIYVYVSSRDRRGVTAPGPEEQEAALRALAQDKGCRVPENRVFRDVCGQGSREDRPGWARLLAWTARDEIKTLFVYSPDCFGQTYLSQVVRTDAFLRHGHSLYFFDLKKDPMDIRCTRRAGIYLDDVQRCFIERALQHAETIQSVFEVGGGTGRFAIPLSRAGYRVVVAEASWLPLLRLRARLSSVNAFRLCQQACSWPVRDESFDCVLAIEVPGIVHQQWFWRECHRVLKPGGIVIATVSNRLSYKGLLAYILASLPAPHRGGPDPGGNRLWFLASSRAVKKQIRDAGLQLHRTRGFGWLPIRQASNSPLIPLLAVLEDACRLDRLSTVSPWLLMEAKKQAADRGSLL